MGKLSNKLRQARRFEVKAGGFTFVLRRPTDLEFMELRGSGSNQRLLSFLIDWQDVKESDITGDENEPHPATFDPEDAREWLSDRPDLFAEISKALIEAYQRHTAELEAKLENLTLGSNQQQLDSSLSSSRTT